MGKILSPDQGIKYSVSGEECDGLSKCLRISILYSLPDLGPEGSELSLDEISHSFIALIEFKDVDPLDLYGRLDVDRGANIAERHHAAFLTWNAEAP